METAHRTFQWHGLPTVEPLVSLGLAGFLMLMGAVSFPLPWTPVPFSMMPFALLVAGAMQRPAYALLSVAIYLLAGGLGAPVFADGDSGFRHFVGATAGYLIAYPLVAALVGSYVAKPRKLLGPTIMRLVLAGLGLGLIGGIGTVAWLWSYNTTLDSGYGVGASVLWALFGLTAVAATAVFFVLRQRQGGAVAANLFAVMMSSLILLLVLGVMGLVFIGDMQIAEAIAVGFVVFLPFDIVKAGLAVAITLPFHPGEPHA